MLFGKRSSSVFISLGEERELACVFSVRLFVLRMLVFVLFLFPLVSGIGCELVIVALPGLFFLPISELLLVLPQCVYFMTVSEVA